MAVTRKTKLLVETICDLCGRSEGTSLIDPEEYESWLKQTTDLLTFNVEGSPRVLCWECMKSRGLTREYNRRLNDLTYPKEPDK